MSIQIRLDNVIKEAENYAKYEKELTEYKALSAVLSEFDNYGFSELKMLQAEHSLLQSRGVSVNWPVADAKTLSSLANDLLQAFNTSATAQSLKAERRLSSAHRVLKKLVTAYRERVDDAYKEYIRLQYGNIGLRDLTVTAAKTPNNSKLLDKFRVEYETFKSIQTSRPITNELLDSLQSSGAKLTQIYKQIDFSIPDDVKRFFDGIESGGASLNLLNESVVKYLEENDMLSTFTIIKTGTVGDH